MAALAAFASACAPAWRGRCLPHPQTRGREHGGTIRVRL